MSVLDLTRPVGIGRHDRKIDTCAVLPGSLGPVNAAS
jgi:hypothetical protein